MKINTFFFLIEVGSSLLRHPSPELSRLISAHSSLSKGERNFQWPVLAFVIQHHDLEGLEIAMKQALRKSACRVFAMEVWIHQRGYWFIDHTNHVMILFNDVTFLPNRNCNKLRDISQLKISNVPIKIKLLSLWIEMILEFHM